MTDRPIRDLDIAFAWTRPWVNLAEIAERIDHTRWTLFGGLMVQLHVLASGKDIIRPTRDVDMLVHIERPDVYVAQVSTALTDLGYHQHGDLSITDDYTSHRWVREGTGTVDQVDALVAEHAAPRAYVRQGRRNLPRMDGATQALQRTFNARVQIIDGQVTTVSVPDLLGALILKSAAARADRNPERHLQDAVALLACLDDPFVERQRLKGSDHQRLHRLLGMLGQDLSAEHWATLTTADRRQALDALLLLVD